MTAEWASLTLREVLEPVKRPLQLDPAESYRTLGVRWYGNGAFVKAPLLGSAIAAKTLNQVRAGDVVYSKLFAWKGSFGSVPAELDGVVASTEFPTYTARHDVLLADYFALWATRPHVWAEADLASTGTTPNSRNRLAPEDFLDLEIDLPPVPVQRAIVNAVNRVRRAEEMSRREARVALTTHAVAREKLIEQASYERVPLDEVVDSVKGGKSPRCLDRPPRDGEYGVLKVSAIRQGRFRPEEAKALPAGMAPFPASVQHGDLLYSRANTTALVGAMCRVPRDYPRLLLCDKTMRVTVQETAIDGEYLVEAVGASSARDHIELMAGGSSDSMKNISQEAYLETEVALPPVPVQRDIAKYLGAFRKSALRAEQSADRLRATREALTEDLVSGLREAPSLAAV